MNLVRLCFGFFGRMNRAKYWIGVAIAFGRSMALSSFFSGLNHKASTGMEASDFGFYCGSSHCLR